MAAISGPNLPTSGLILNIDAANPKNSGLTNVEVLVVAGGGGGGYRHGAGGGAGGLIYKRNHSVTPGNLYTITVGNGGAGGTGSHYNGYNGENSSAFGLTAVGGGYGGSYDDPGTTGGNGGSGGGSGQLDGIGGTGTSEQGHVGGNGSSSNYKWGGGGGAGAPGVNGFANLTTSTYKAGDGGKGLSFDISGTLVWYAGGGGGGSHGPDNGVSSRGLGGFGGGGNGGTPGTVSSGDNGTANTGGGGGGAATSYGGTGVGGNGGSGIVIVRYNGPCRAMGGNVVKVGNDTVHFFTSSGTFTPLSEYQSGSSIASISDFSGSNIQSSVSGAIFNSGNSGIINFDGSNDYAYIPFTPTRASPYTVLLWAKPSILLAAGTTSANRKTLITGPGPNWNPGIWVKKEIIRSHANTQYKDNTINWSDLSWHQIGQVYDGTNVYNIWDGQILSGGTASGYSPSAQTSLLLGAEVTAGSAENWAGSISNVQIFNSALSATDIKINYISFVNRYFGMNPGAPASSVADLRAHGITTDGMYWFSTRWRTQPFQAYVKFNYIDGGDWYLLLKVHNQGDLPSGSAYWTNDTLYNEDDANLTSGTWSKYATWTGISFTRLMMVMTQGGTAKIPPIMIFNTSRTFSDAIRIAGGSSAYSGYNNIVKADSTDPAIATNATYWNVSMKSGTAFTDSAGTEDILQAYGIGMWANNSTNSTTAETFSSTGRAGAWIGAPLDNNTHTTGADSNIGSDSGFGFGASGGNPAKTTSAGYNEWTITSSTNTLPGYVWIRE